MLILRNPLTVSLAAALAAGMLIAGCGGDDDGSAEGEGGDAQTLRMALGSEPPSLDPGLATDITSFYVIQALMDPLVKLGDDLEPEPAVAESWDVTDGGKTVTFSLREGGRWTNGDPVTAGDFEYAWKRLIAPETAAGYAYQFYGIVGAQEYNGCDAKKVDCEALRDDVGVRALDERTLEVKLTSSQPWFVAQAAHLSFLPVHRATVEAHGEKWTEPRSIVTNGPFRLTKWSHDETLTLQKWPEWREAGTVSLNQVQLKIIPQATTAIQAFEAGEIDVCLEQPACIPSSDFERMQETPEYAEFPALLTTYLGVNVKNVPLAQRRALALAIDRASLVENVVKAGSPATSFTPKGMPGFDSIAQDYLTEGADLERARAALGSEKPDTLGVFGNSDELSKETLVAVQAMWQDLGIKAQIKTQEWAQFLEFLGPPPDSSVDLFLIGWIGDYVDDINFLELWTCESGNNPTNYCDPAYDRLIDEARSTPDDSSRHELYAQAEAMLTGPEGAFPIIPLTWGTAPILRRETIEGLELNLLGQFDWTKISIEKEG